MEISISLGKHRNSLKWNNKKVSWEWILEKSEQTHYTSESVKEYIAFDKERQAEIKDCNGAFVGARTNQGKRSKTAIMYRSLLTLDADWAKRNFWSKFTMNFDCAGLIYSTHKHTPEKPRYRLVIPFSRQVTVAEYEAICRRVAEMIGIDQIDPTSYDINRLMYWPSTPKDGVFVFKHQEGEFLDPDEILETYEDWTDLSSWPVGESESKALHSEMKQQADPTTKPGIVGAWCRTYGVEDVMENDIPGVYENSDDGERWSYAAGSGANGLVIYGHFAYSNHGTDPAGKQLVNAFDIVRIHKFGNLDSERDREKSGKDLPSFKAMADYASADREVTKLLMQEKIAAAGEAFSGLLVEKVEGDESREAEAVDSGDWLGDLDQDKRGILGSTHKNIRLILQNDPRLKGAIGYNEFTYKTEVLRDDLPWAIEPIPRPWLVDDWHGLNAYLGEPPYEIKARDAVKDVVFGIRKKHRFNPIKDYLNSLEWDGKKRLDTMFVDYLGAADSEYTRAVTRKTFTAAVARVFEPGIKFDNVLTLVGPQGKGKSTIIKKMGGRWFRDTFNFGMLTGNSGIKAIEQVQGAWIVEFGEMAGLKKAEIELAKTFLSSSEDIYRPAYAEDDITRARQGIFIGSTNNSDFLVAANGNRRFWIVVTHTEEPEKNIFKSFTSKVRNQMWAEAYHYYREKEELMLPDHLEEEANVIQEEHEEGDEWTGIINEWLDKPIDSDNAFAEEKKYRTRVCASEIWTQVLGGNVRDINNGNTKRIHNIMKKMNGWQLSKSKLTIPGFKFKQRAYTRINKKPPRFDTWMLN